MSTERRFVGTSHQAEATPHRQEAGRNRHDAAYDYAVKSHTHMWLVIVQHHASEKLLDSIDNPETEGLPLLDVDTMLGPPALVCYVCETPYDRQARRRKCPGEPK